MFRGVRLSYPVGDRKVRHIISAGSSHPQFLRTEVLLDLILRRSLSVSEGETKSYVLYVRRRAVAQITQVCLGMCLSGPVNHCIRDSSSCWCFSSSATSFPIARSLMDRQEPPWISVRKSTSPSTSDPGEAVIMCSERHMCRESDIIHQMVLTGKSRPTQAK